MALGALVGRLALAGLAWSGRADEQVTLANFNRALTDTYFRSYVDAGALGKFVHHRTTAPINQEGENRQSDAHNDRDTLYSWLVLDLSCPARVLFPEPSGRFVSLSRISEDHDVFPALYDPGEYEFTQENIGTPYMIVSLRVFVDSRSPSDVKVATELQDRFAVRQNCPNWTVSFLAPRWDPYSLSTVRSALLTLFATKPDGSKRMFGMARDLDRLNHLMGTAAGWASLSERDIMYDAFRPGREHADGKTLFHVDFKGVPLVGSGLWSFTVYNEQGFMFNPGPASWNSVTAAPNPDGGYTLHFGGCGDPSRVNCLPITRGWNYLIRVYRPGQGIIDGTWRFPPPRQTTASAHEL